MFDIGIVNGDEEKNNFIPEVTIGFELLIELIDG
jgi:hypothetical protein